MTEPPPSPSPAPSGAPAATATTPRRRSFLLVADTPLPEALAGLPSMSADRYLEGVPGSLEEGLVVVNLCRSYQYLSKGYYVSLLAEARRQRALPTLEDIEETSNPFTYLRTLQEAGLKTIDYSVQGTVPGKRRVLPRRIVVGDRAMLEGLSGEAGVKFTPAAPGGFLDVTTVFGRAGDPRFRRVCAAIWRLYAFPLLRVRLYENGEGWKVGQVQPLNLPQVGPAEVAALAEKLAKGAAARAVRLPAPPLARHRLAVLWDPLDPTAPSDEPTLDKLARIGARRGLLVERIAKTDLARLAEFDALFIRTVTAINHFSFTFSQTAEGLGIPVIDDTGSIIKCSNKIFLYELFRRNGLPMPDTAVISPKKWREEVRPLGLPVILKVPDGTFSLAVKKAENEAELEALTRDMFKRSPLLIAQRFTPTEFDWRVGVLEGQVLWVARYHMAKRHWQIAKRSAGGTRFGRVEAVPAADAPPEVLSLALAGAALIGDGLYGVDIKETADGPVLIEINDNPNLEAGYEDTAERDRPYEAILDAFQRRIAEEGRVAPPAPAGAVAGGGARPADGAAPAVAVPA
ncbi:MAG TPA: RimK family protein, partial [Thermoanaerobaculia bacterium]|nr:RimK family protein [Thermoanaerobaculia bacterium]